MSQKIEQMLEKEISVLEQALAALRGTRMAIVTVAASSVRTKRRISAAGIERIRAAQKKRWAKQHRTRRQQGTGNEP